ncbi:hypothetical protein [Azoarcus sp. KH32C]|uniref:hypothetical protein n=1 Tax=Azoarcus sp. KH32C TaxID=748247 RepID=UPI0002386ADF|nr:hypothetical protein [Azoarcus sp. KH32C]BAL26518.1 hypothetical protein AZKH_4239 [Azoarcus sp. KH32C]
MNSPIRKDSSRHVPEEAAADKENLGPRQVIEQAARDIRRGLRDTDRHGTPSDVPGPGVPPERSPGAAVPEEGVNVAAHSPKAKHKGKPPGR